MSEYLIMLAAKTRETITNLFMIMGDSALPEYSHRLILPHKAAKPELAAQDLLIKNSELIKKGPKNTFNKRKN